MLLDRTKRADRYLEWKVRLFSVAAVFALVGIYMDNRWLTGTAIALLLAGFALRFLPDDTQELDAPDGD
jgi:hypothetical protein